jgi:hypothetical protein
MRATIIVTVAVAVVLALLEDGIMLTKLQVWHRVLSRWFGHWCAKHNMPYRCPMWANNDAYTAAYLEAKGIIR